MENWRKLIKSGEFSQQSLPLHPVCFSYFCWVFFFSCPPLLARPMFAFIRRFVAFSSILRDSLLLRPWVAFLCTSLLRGSTRGWCESRWTLRNANFTFNPRVSFRPSYLFSFSF
ncbi:unnamed protein product [Ixodes pacificus]